MSIQLKLFITCAVVLVFVWPLFSETKSGTVSEGVFGMLTILGIIGLIGSVLWLVWS